MGYTTTTRLALRQTIPEGRWTEDAKNTSVDHATNFGFIDGTLYGAKIPAINATVIDTGGLVNVFLTASSMLCIASITGMTAYTPFTIYIYTPTPSNCSIGLFSAGAFRLAGNFLAPQYSSITLVWDGTKYYELRRSLAA